jgi:hypothetical protein
MPNTCAPLADAMLRNKPEPQPASSKAFSSSSWILSKVAWYMGINVGSIYSTQSAGEVLHNLPCTSLVCIKSFFVRLNYSFLFLKGCKIEWRETHEDGSFPKGRALFPRGERLKKKFACLFVLTAPSELRTARWNKQPAA